MNTLISKLEWDSDFFGFNVAKVQISENSLLNYDLLTQALANECVDLAFINLPSHLKTIATTNILHKLGAYLTDTKIVFSKNIPFSLSAFQHPNISSYKENSVSNDLLQLAYISGEHSRFRTDLKMPVGTFEKLYTIWITKAVQRTFDDELIVYTIANKILGMISIKLGPSTANIGLLAVAPEAQGKGIGQLLMEAATAYAKINNCTTLTVPTQLQNVQACNFYTKAGFTLAENTEIYHWWKN